jgi:PAS domain S-box-containing protein
MGLTREERTAGRALLCSLAAIYDRSPDAVAIVAAAGAIVIHANPVYATLSGCSTEEVVGRPCPWLADAGAANAIGTAFSRGAPARTELKVSRKDGTSCRIELSILPVSDDRGGASHFILVGRDLAAETAVTVLLSEAVESINEGFVLCDADDRVLVCNERMLDRFPHLRELGPLQGRSFETLMRHGIERGYAVDPQTVDDPEQWLAQRLERHRRGTGMPLVRRLPNGRWLQTTDHRTASGGVVSVHADITPLKQVEARLRDAIESFDAVFTLWDSEARLLMWNRRFPETWPTLADLLVPGVSQRTLIERNIDCGMLVVPAEDRERYIEERLAQHRKPFSQVELLRSDGRIFLIRSHRTAEGGQARLETDVTEMRHREEELRQAKESAEAASRSKSTFLASMSHELRTPLNAIIGFSDILRNEMFGRLGSPRYASYAHDIHISGNYLLELINDVLDVSRIEAGRLELHPEPTSVRELIEDTHRLISETAEQSGVRLTCAAFPDLPTLSLDRRATRQVLLNLLSNAIKFTPRGGEVTIGAAADGDAVTISVVDTGIGIPERDLPRLATPFEQVGSVLTRVKTGSGLGLAITKALVERHGGKLTIASRVGEGTRVTVSFLVRDVADLPQRELASSA